MPNPFHSKIIALIRCESQVDDVTRDLEARNRGKALARLKTTIENLQGVYATLEESDHA